MPLHHLTRFPRLELIGAPTPLEYLPRLSDYLGREIYIKRDDVTPIAMGGNKLRKLEFLVASGSAGTHAGLAVGLEHLMPDVELIGVTVSRSVAEQRPKVIALQQAIAGQLALTATADIHLWDDYFAPGYGVPNDAGMEAVKLLASLEGVLLDPVYTGKAMAGLIDGISQKRFNDDGPILFIHTGGAPALFAYHPHV
ncbi:pyridoxal-phosphate dependent enzyme [Salmonella enterica]|nr:pyridoxal-phosphate dependent enzyme [Salmonella enterica]EAP2592308.1 pyridoxal-phosphate dependent enzyme [Salmonella enterica]